MPTVDAENETAGRLDGGSEKLPFWAKIQRELAAEGISPPPLHGHRRVRRTSTEPARRCLERIAKHNMILATGHLGRREIFALVRAAGEDGPQEGPRDARRISVAEPDRRRAEGTGRPRARSSNTASRRPTPGKAPWETAFANIRKTGVSRTLISTDLGQTINPPVAEGFAMFAQRLLDAGFSVGRGPHDGGHESDAARRRIEVGSEGQGLGLEVSRPKPMPESECAGRHRMKICLAGTGAMGVIHMKALKKIDGVEVVVDRQPHRREREGVCRGVEHSVPLDESRSLHRSPRRRRRDSDDAERAARATRRCWRSRRASTSRSRFR